VFEHAPCHVQQQYAGKTLLWCSIDSEQEYNKNLKKTRQRELLSQNGWVDHKIEYQYNAQGFRSREIDLTQPGFAVFGCSFTQGLGLPVDELYHERISKELSLPVDNFGVFGASNGLAFRLAHYWLPIIKPRFVILQTTFRERFEIINQYNVSTVMSPQFDEATTQEVFRDWWFTDANSIADKQRNELAIQQVCHQLDIPVLVIDVEDFRNPVLGLSRDLTHPGPPSHHRVHAQIIDHLKSYQHG
jgi:hypothetical protein